MTHTDRRDKRKLERIASRIDGTSDKKDARFRLEWVKFKAKIAQAKRERQLVRGAR